MAPRRGGEDRSWIAWSVGLPLVFVGVVLLYWPIHLHWGLGRRWVVLYDRPTFVAGTVLLAAGVVVLLVLLPSPRRLAVAGGILSGFGVSAALVGPLLPIVQGRFFGGVDPSVETFLPDWLVWLSSAVVGGWLLGRWARLERALGCGGLTGPVVAVLALGVIATLASLSQHAIWFHSELEQDRALGYVADAEFGYAQGGPVKVADVNLLPAEAPVTSRPPVFDTPVGPVPYVAWVATQAMDHVIEPGTAIPDVTIGLGEAGHEPRPCSTPHPFYVAVPVTALDLAAGGDDRVIGVSAGEGVTDYDVRLDDGLEIVVRRPGGPSFAEGDDVTAAYVGPPSDYRASSSPTAIPNSLGELYESTCRGDADAWGGPVPNPVLIARFVVLVAFCLALAAGAGWAAVRSREPETDA